MTCFDFFKIYLNLSFLLKQQYKSRRFFQKGDILFCWKVLLLFSARACLFSVASWCERNKLCKGSDGSFCLFSKKAGGGEFAERMWGHHSVISAATAYATFALGGKLPFHPQMWAFHCILHLIETYSPLPLVVISCILVLFYDSLEFRLNGRLLI